METLPQMIGFIIAAITAIIAIRLNWSQREQLKSDAAGIITDAALSLVEPLEKENKELRQELNTLKKMFEVEIGKLRNRIQKLEIENSELRQENNDLKKKKLL